VGGLIGFAIALLLLVSFILLKREQKVYQVKAYSFLIWIFIRTNAILLWLGIQPVEAPFVLIGQIITFFYFSYIFITFILDEILNKLYN
jgi:quinol-cytochrome oxidoreductase complex cytochrome b subunit